MIKCPECGSKKITPLPSSTLPIEEREDGYYLGDKKAPKEIVEKHLSIKNICTDCGLEW